MLSNQHGQVIFMPPLSYYYYFLLCVAPSRVNNVVIGVLTNSSITVTWNPPSAPNGILTNYDIIVFNELTGFYFLRTIHSLDEEVVTVEGLGNNKLKQLTNYMQ